MNMKMDRQKDEDFILYSQLLEKDLQWLF